MTKRSKSHLNRVVLIFACLFSGIWLLLGSAVSVYGGFGIGTHRIPPRSNVSDQDDRKSKEVRLLEPGTPLVGELTGSKFENFEVRLNSNQHVRLTVEELTIDVTVRLFGPDDKLIIQVDNPNDSRALELVLFISVMPGTHRVEVRSVDKKEPLGRFVVKLEEMREATKDDLNRVSAQQLFMEAEQLRSKRTVESIQKSIPKYEESRSVYFGIADERGVATTIFGIGKAYVGLGEKQKAVANYQQAAARFASLKDDRNEADVLYVTGVLLDQLNEKLKAIEVLDHSLTLWRRRKNEGRMATGLYYLGTVHNDLNDRKKALACLTEAIPLHRAAGDLRGEATTQNYLGDVYLNEGENEQALDYYTRALAIRRDLKDRAGEAQTLQNLGLLYLAWSKTQEALNNLQHAFTIYRTLDDPTARAETLALLGMTYSSLADYKEALNYLEQALTLVTNDQETTAKVLMVMATVYGNLGDTDKALACHEKARPIIESMNQPAAEAASLFNIGILQLRRKEFSKAFDSLERCRSLAQRAGERRMEVWSLALSGLALHLIGDNQRAFDRLVATLPTLQAFGDLQFQALVLASLAAIERDRGNLIAAKSRIEAAITLLESLRNSVISQDLRLSFFSSVQIYFDFSIDTLMRLHKKRPGEGFDVAALETTERSRARSLLDLLNEAGADIHRDVNPELTQRERSLRQKLNSTVQSRLRLLGGFYTSEEARMSASDIDTLTSDYRKIQAEIRRASPRYAALAQPQPLPLSGIQAQIDADTLILSYKLGDNGNYLWLVSKTDAAGYELPAGKEIETLARNFFELLTKRNEPLDTEMTQNALRLSQMILGPVAPRLGQKRLVIVADGALQYVPFAALPDPSLAASDSDRAQPLIVRHEIVSLPSMSVLGTLRSEVVGREKPVSELVIIADPVFDNRDKRIKKKGPIGGLDSGGKSVGKLAGSDSLPNGKIWDRLPGTRIEADRISAVIGSDKINRTLDFAANREFATSGALSRYRHVLFATHAEVNDLHPELSAIVLSLVDENGNPRDGYLRLNEIYNLKLSAELVVLSGCQTGLGKEIRGEGLIGLTRGFMYAGAARVTASLWQVDDFATAELMTRFYRGMIKEGKSPGSALRAAQLELLRSHRWHAAHYWAAFIMQGEWR